MPDLSTITIFLGASLVLLLTPGPAVLFVVTRAVDQGRLAGVVSSMGLAVGTLVHVAGVVLGLSVLLVSSANAYAILKYLGAAYLVYLGARKLVGRDEPQKLGGAERNGLSKLFYQGIVVNVLNPKLALFFLAFLPQFADASRGGLTTQLGVLGLSFVALGIVTDIFYALLAGTARTWLVRSKVFLHSQRYVAGIIYIGLGVATAVTGSNARE